jgi:hypothetical protein
MKELCQSQIGMEGWRAWEKNRDRTVLRDRCGDTLANKYEQALNEKRGENEQNVRKQ